MTAGRPKLAIADAYATGAAIANPQRYQASVDLTLHPLGPPSPDIIDNGLTDEWLFIVKSVSWLTEADRRLVELACVYRANFWRRAAYRRLIVEDDDGKIDTGWQLPYGKVLTHEEMFLMFVDDKATGLELRILEKLGCTPTSRPKVTPPNGKSSGRRKDWW